ncbi:VOC family protein [Chryseobacterium sp. HSC-36S06]|uniref:VOC family protein n=1 Tax=Chryseobacterium sp. HSC-36S06 TaxID=2910970 RepID=UPI00209FD6F4|nr:VOC family protein [Chryseobacterium sp. HSC-36S06]MCP2038739.1 catechol 2,3-dioxygenase-like lactoylglutathione lyase family enzyme [Chryseobacterium sp. HSC-36S06]
MKSIQKIHTILYVENQEISTEFYTKILRLKPDLNVPGMTEFHLTDDFTLGLMPNSGIAKILAGKTPPPESGTGIPRCELYLYVDDIEAALKNIHDNQIAVISGLQERNWGDMAFYFADPDGHIIAFATKIKN